MSWKDWFKSKKAPEPQVSVEPDKSLSPLEKYKQKTGAKVPAEKTGSTPSPGNDKISKRKDTSADIEDDPFKKFRNAPKAIKPTLQPATEVKPDPVTWPQTSAQTGVPTQDGIIEGLHPMPPLPEARPKPVPPASATGRTAATFGTRFLAELIDTWILLFMVGVARESISSLHPLTPDFSTNLLHIFRADFGSSVNLIVRFIYFGWFYQERGATPGKMLVGIEVVDFGTGQRLSFFRAGFRDVVGKMISGAILFAGFLLAAVRSDRRSLHDLIFHSQVVVKE